MADAFVFYNNFQTEITDDPLSSTATTINVDSVGDLVSPSSGQALRLTLFDFDSVEVVDVTSISGTALTVTRGAEGTTAQSWDKGTKIEARLTADALSGMAQGFDSFGDPDGTGAATVQGGRESADQVASGPYALAAGYSSKANSYYALAVGAYAEALGDDIPAWAAGEAVSARSTSSTLSGGVSISNVTPGDLRQLSTADYVAYCIQSGTTGSSEPTNELGIVTDGSAKWLIVYMSQYSRAMTTAVGRSMSIGGGASSFGYSNISVGDSALSVGEANSAIGQGAVSIGVGGEAFGAGTVAIGRNANVRGNYSIGIRRSLSLIDGRNTQYVVGLNARKYAAFDYAKNIPGFEFIAKEWDYSGSAVVREALNQGSSEVVIHSAPVQMGDRAWAASTTYNHGDAVIPTTPNGFSYVAYRWSGYYASGVSGSSEPTWPTVAGDTVDDGDITWTCVDLSGIEFVLPDYARFTPASLGVIAHSCTPGGSPVQPDVSFGVTGNLSKWVSATTLTKMTGDLANEFLEPANTEGAKQFGAAVTTNGSDIDCTAVLVLRGFVVETLSA